MPIEIFKLFFTGVAFLLAMLVSWAASVDFNSILIISAFIVAMRTWSENIWITLYIKYHKQEILDTLQEKGEDKWN